MSSINNCGKCLALFSFTTETVKCDGFCNNHFHLSCANLTRTSYKPITTNDNMFWFCDVCRDLLKSGAVKAKITDENKDGGSMKDEFSSMMGELKSVLHTVSAEMVLNRKSMENLVTKLDNQPALNSSSLNRPVAVPIESGRKRKAVDENAETDGPIRGVKLSEKSTKVIAPKFWIHISRFETSMTETEISEIVGESLNISNLSLIKTVKLIPKNRTIESLDYVTFKVGIDESSKELAMNPSVWPKNVMIRPFKDLGGSRRPTYSSALRNRLAVRNTNSSPLPANSMQIDPLAESSEGAHSESHPKND